MAFPRYPLAMNRTTVLILAIVLLLAHVLALHHDAYGAYAMPSDLAHVDFRIGRNWVHGLGTVWGAGTSAAAIAEEGGTSFLWILIAAGAELFSLSPLRVASWVGILATLLTLAFIARLSRDRLIGVTAIVLLVVSGPIAAAASDGTETSLFTLLLTVAFLAFERRRSGVLGLSLALLVLTRSMGLVFALVLLAFALRTRGSERPIRFVRAFVPALLAAALLGSIRVLYDAPLLTPQLAALFAGDQAMLGLWSAEAWLRGTLAPLLVVLPLLALVTGRLSGTGSRALVLGLVGVATTVLTGASSAAMHTAFAPALPLLFIAVQEAFVGGLERRPQHEWAVWTSLSLACLMSMLASKNPGDLGPLRTEPLLEWMARETPMRRAAFGREWSGRRAIIEELDENARLRGIGHFFRDQAAPGVRILSPWPGAMGYLSRMTVLDLLDRAVVEPSWADARTSTQPWTGRARTDVVKVLSRGTEYVVALAGRRPGPPTMDELVTLWLTRFDVHGDTPARRAELVAALEPYELLAVSTPTNEANLSLPSETPSWLLRRKALGLTPALTLTGEDRALVVRASHAGHHQIVELEVEAELDGERHYLDPTGRFVADGRARARTELLLFPTGERRIKLIEFELPKRLAGAAVRARLLNPFSDPNDPLALVGEPVELNP